ncbi:MAG TPA: ABC transporter ATP-binding protein [Bacilli bacterium]|nr:ABC transporter ATP-binding protein [Bacilli bacterium]
MEKLIELKNVSKTFKMGKIETKALNNIDLDVEQGEILIILGASGGGKTTLLNVISGLDKIDKKKNSYIKYDGKIISNYSDFKMTRFRKNYLGFIFQTYNLLEHLNVKENVLVGSRLAKNNVDIDEIIDIVGLTKHKNKYMHELSGGEQQRISIARALAKQPKVMFCDEPTGALDEKTGKKVLESLVEANEKLGTTLIIVTHNPGIALIGDRIIKMNSGKIVETIENKKRTNPKDIPWG